MKINKEINIIIIIFALSHICFELLKNNTYMPLADLGREFFIPSEIIKGKTLYKDIFNVYAPLGYLINAFWIKYLGNSLNAFYLIGFILSFFSLTALYKISKLFTGSVISLLLTVFIMVSCTFYPSISNWITPYSYSIMYALASILWAVYFLLKYIETNKKKYLYFSTLLYGFSISSKYEYILFVIPLLITIIKEKKNLQIKEYLLLFLFFLLCPFLSFVILIFQGISITDLFQSIKYAIALSHSFSANFFYIYSGLLPSLFTIKSAFLSLFNPHFPTFFYSVIIINFITLFFTIKSDFKLLILSLSAILLSYKVLGGITFEIYGTYFFPLLFISLVSFLYKKINSKLLGCMIIILSLSYSFFIIENNNMISIHTNKGLIKVKEEFYEPIIKMNEFISKTNTTDKILILPEGVLLNWLSGRSTDDYLFYLIPPHSEILTDEYVINKIENGNYKYIAISNIIYPWFNQKSFSTSWGKNVVDYIKLKYENKQIIGEKFKFYIYEKK